MIVTKCMLFWIIVVFHLIVSLDCRSIVCIRLVNGNCINPQIPLSSAPIIPTPLSALHFAEKLLVLAGFQVFLHLHRTS